MTEETKVRPTAVEPGDLMLYEPVTYRAGDGSWHADFLQTVKQTPGPLTWDPGAVHSILCYGYPCGDRTLFEQISRKPWLSSIDADGEPVLLDIPPHGRRAATPQQIAENLAQLTEDEIVAAAEGHDRLMLLLSGGLDSRVVAGLTSRAIRKGRISVPVVAVTWGMDNCRDVVYGKAVADVLGLEWIHVGLEPEDLLKNIDLASESLAGLSSPVHLHRMDWFDQAPPNTLVLGGSYGDSVGRAEFSSKHLLEVRPMTTGSAGGPMSRGAQALGTDALAEDLRQLRRRGKGQPQYVICEMEMQGHYMRGMISHVMNVINRHCTLYQAFTHPSVYGYMWSIHPAMRSDEPYAALLASLNKDLAALPWARTNRALRGPTRGAVRDAVKGFHEYPEWIGGILFDRLWHELDIPLLESTGLFDRHAVEELASEVRARKGATLPSYHLTWLLAFQRLLKRVNEMGVTVEPLTSSTTTAVTPLARRRRLRERLTQVPVLVRGVRRLKKWNRWRVRRRALREFPPEPELQVDRD